jgi:hypothetical protein
MHELCTGHTPCSPKHHTRQQQWQLFNQHETINILIFTVPTCLRRDAVHKDVILTVPVLLLFTTKPLQDTSQAIEVINARDQWTTSCFSLLTPFQGPYMLVSAATSASLCEDPTTAQPVHVLCATAQQKPACADRTQNLFFETCEACEESLSCSAGHTKHVYNPRWVGG